MWFLIITVILSPTIISALETSCNADFCDPNWTPFKNMVSGLRGYNIRSGNPFHDTRDPGFGGQIFVPTKVNKRGRIELEAGIAASELSYCKRSMSSRSFTTIDSYRKYITQSSSSGVDLQIGTDTEVTAGIDLKGASVSATKTIPKPFERSWGESRDFKELTSFFSEEKGMITVAMGTCTMYEMQLNPYHMPPFTKSFGIALTDLFKERDKAAHSQKAAFKKFTNTFGTHFLIRSSLGAQYIYRSKYSETARREFKSETLKSCNYVKGAKFFGIQVEQSKTKCSSSDMQKLNQLHSSEIEKSEISKGSRPTEVKKWVIQDFIPVPLQFTLSPIINLMVDDYIKPANLNSSGVAVKSFEIRKWFVPLYFHYCTSMNVDCGPQKGCGIDDNCPVDTVCLAGGTKHECSNWGQWSCTVNCGQGTQMRRSRTCTGCKGDLTQYANKYCARQKECYKHNPTCETKHTTWGAGDPNVHYLDRLLVDCGYHQILKSFGLERDGDHRYYRYKYECCQPQLRCHSNTWRDSARSYVHPGKNEFYYLDRQAVGCPNDGLLSGFRLQSWGNDVYYKFRCCSLPQPKTCHDRYTDYSDDGSGDTVYLNRQHPKCPAGYGMSYFKLKRGYVTRHIFSIIPSVRYHYKCCKINPN